MSLFNWAAVAAVAAAHSLLSLMLMPLWPWPVLLLLAQHEQVLLVRSDGFVLPLRPNPFNSLDGPFAAVSESSVGVGSGAGACAGRAPPDVTRRLHDRLRLPRECHRRLGWCMRPAWLLSPVRWVGEGRPARRRRRAREGDKAVGTKFATYRVVEGIPGTPRGRPAPPGTPPTQWRPISWTHCQLSKKALRRRRPQKRTVLAGKPWAMDAKKLYAFVLLAVGLMQSQARFKNHPIYYSTNAAVIGRPGTANSTGQPGSIN